MKNKIISILCAMAISLTAFAQTNVKGVVTDKNGEAVTGAMVLNKDNGKWAVTDAAGAFELEGAENLYGLRGLYCQLQGRGHSEHHSSGRCAPA